MCQGASDQLNRENLIESAPWFYSALFHFVSHSVSHFKQTQDKGISLSTYAQSLYQAPLDVGFCVHAWPSSFFWLVRQEAQTQVPRS